MNSLFNNYTGYDYCTESTKACCMVYNLKCVVRQSVCILFLDYCTESTKACWCIISIVSLDSLYAFSFFLLQCLQDHWQSLLLEHNFLSECTHNVTEIKCKTGNKFFSFPLASWLYLFLPPLFLFHSIPFSFSLPSYKFIYMSYHCSMKHPLSCVMIEILFVHEFNYTLSTLCGLWTDTGYLLLLLLLLLNQSNSWNLCSFEQAYNYIVASVLHHGTHRPWWVLILLHVLPVCHNSGPNSKVHQLCISSPLHLFIPTCSHNIS